MTTKRLRELLRWLRADHPLDLPARIARGNEEVWGSCSRLKKYYLIRIHRSLDSRLQELVLIHEWAHALAWTSQMLSKEKESHDTLFGVAYARIWRGYCEDFTDDTHFRF